MSYQISRDVLVTDPESVATQVKLYEAAVRVMGHMEQVADTIRYTEFAVEANGKWRGQTLQSLVASLPRQVDCIFPMSENASMGALPRVRIEKVGRRKYAAWQKTVAVLCAMGMIALLWHIWTT